jgi:ABC-type multidrug transport system ATPase subunit
MLNGIRCALLKNPAVVVLDEPTSGLDSSKASEVMEACEQLTRLGRTVICTIHQPRIDIFNMFHYVMYVAAGEVVYVGPPHLTAPAFEQATGGKCNANENLADFVIDCLVRALSLSLSLSLSPSLSLSLPLCLSVSLSLSLVLSRFLVASLLY